MVSICDTTNQSYRLNMAWFYVLRLDKDGVSRFKIGSTRSFKQRKIQYIYSAIWPPYLVLKIWLEDNIAYDIEKTLRDKILPEKKIWKDEIFETDTRVIVNEISEELHKWSIPFCITLPLGSNDGDEHLGRIGTDIDEVRLGANIVANPFFYSMSHYNKRLSEISILKYRNRWHAVPNWEDSFYKLSSTSFARAHTSGLRYLKNHISDEIRKGNIVRTTPNYISELS